MTRPRKARRQPATRTDDAYTQIKERIIDLRMAPGSSFSESGLAADIGIGKTPIREALVRLELEGLVEVIPRSGYRVSPVTLKDARDLLNLRALLEAEAARLAAGHAEDGESLRVLEELCQASYDPRDSVSIRRFLRANTEFHATIASVGGNRRLARTLRQVLEQLERLFHLGLALSSREDEVVHEHQDLVEAILRGDPGEAARIALAQCRTAQQMVVQALLSSEAVVNADVISLSQAGRHPTAGS